MLARTTAVMTDGPERAAMQAKNPDCIFAGMRTGEDLAAHYASGDVFLFPSTTDTFGNVILESLASGVPCIVSDVGGPKDLIEPGVTGYVTKALDVEDFSEKTARLAGDAALREGMRTAARKAVEGRDWSEAGRRFWGAK